MIQHHLEPNRQGRVEHTLRAILDITSMQDLGFPDQIRGILELGSRQLGLAICAVTRLDGDRLILPYVVGGSDAVPEGMAVQVCDSFCGESAQPPAFATRSGPS